MIYSAEAIWYFPGGMKLQKIEKAPDKDTDRSRSDCKV
jgi:hypothetical protein